MPATARPTRDERRREARERRLAAEREAAERVRLTRRLWQLGGVVAAAAIIVATAIAVSSSGGAKPAARPGRRPAQAGAVSRLLAGIPQRGIELGAPGAPVTLVEFADLKCPVCRAYTLDVLPTLLRRYVRTGELKIQFRAQHFVGEQLNPGDSLAAARFAEAAGRQNRLWNFAELFYVNQQDESTRYVSDAYLRRLGAAIPGLAVNRAFADRSSAAVTAQLQRSAGRFDAHGFTGTPSFLLGRSGATLASLGTGQLSLDQFTGAIDRLLGR